MKKIYLIVIGAFLILLVIISMIIFLGKKSIINTQKDSLFPTSIPRQESINQQANPQNNQQNILEENQKNSLPTSNQQNNFPTSSMEDNIAKNLPSESEGLSNLPFDISTIEPVETEDFKLQYSSKQNKIIIERKTPQAEKQLINWANQNQLPQLINNPNLTLIVDLGKNPDDFDPLLEFLNIFMNFGSSIQNLPTGQADQPVTITPFQGLPTTTNPQPNITPNPDISPDITPPLFSGEKVFYAQCNGYGDLSLPDGCNLCQAGCGPTTVAIIAASYLGNSFNPKTIVDTYKSNGYLLGCDGSNFSDAKQVLQNLGLKTTDYLIFNAERSDTVVPELRKYLSAGWTFFTLASFCDSGCGHYFWIIDIDDQGNIWAYDPYYGRYEIPYNENSRYPYPQYRLAFGVKK